MALAFLSVVPVFAQGGASLLTGTVRDVNDGVLPGVTVRVTNVATNAGSDVVTDGEGVYRAPALVTSTYRVEAALDGFETSALQVIVSDGQATLDVTLSPSRLTESGVVAARRVEEVAQEVPIPVSVTRGDRSTFSSSASASTALVVDGYTLLNARFGFRAAEGWTLSVWSRNLLDTEYYDLLSAVPGNSGLYVGQHGDQRTVGVTLRLSFRR